MVNAAMPMTLPQQGLANDSAWLTGPGVLPVGAGMLSQQSSPDSAGHDASPSSSMDHSAQEGSTDNNNEAQSKLVSSTGMNDAEGVWSSDIDQAFNEALAIYPPCGRRKIILSDEGKMYGRNELIARYIKLRTGKTRTRKQVSSHIQVLARKKTRELHAKLKTSNDPAQKEKVLAGLNGMSSSQIVSATVSAGAVFGDNRSPVKTEPLDIQQDNNNRATPAALSSPPPTVHSGHPQMPADALASLYSNLWPAASQALLAATSASPSQAKPHFDIKPFIAQQLGLTMSYAPGLLPSTITNTGLALSDITSISTSSMRLCEFCAYVESRTVSDVTRHELVRINQVHHNPDARPLEEIDIREIYDKFPREGGLKDLYEQGPQDAFYLVKFWADVNFDIPDSKSAFYAVDSRLEGLEDCDITVSTKVCSFGNRVVEKFETEKPTLDPSTGRYQYRFEGSPMCDYMINFILKLKELPENTMRNVVLENFTILQVITRTGTQDTLLVVAFVFEVTDTPTHYNVYRLLTQ